MDRFGLDVLLPFEKPVRRWRLGRAHHAYKTILSQDASCFTGGFPPGLREQMLRDHMAPNWHFVHVIQNLLPALD